MVTTDIGLGFCWSPLVLLCVLQMVCVCVCVCVQVNAARFQELQAPVNSEAKNMASVVFFKTTWQVATHYNILGDYCNAFFL